MQKIIVYVGKGSKSQVIQLDNLKKGHEKFNEINIKGDFDYLELGIDRIDVNGTYSIIRSLNK